MDGGVIFFIFFFSSFSFSYQSSDLPLFQTLTTSDSPQQHQWEQSILRLQARDAARLQYLSALVSPPRRPPKSSAPVASGRRIVQSPTYVVKARLGTPPQPLLLSLDTANDAALVPCSGGVFSPAASTSFRNLSCSSPRCDRTLNPTCASGACAFNLTYGSSAMTATLSEDTLSVSAEPIPSYAFSCIRTANGTSVPRQGLLGLGRGPLSLPSQTHSLYNSTFSYCLPSFSSSNFTGSLRLGSVGQPAIQKSTPLLRSQHRSTFYYVDLVGVKVGRRTVSVPPRALGFDAATGAGTIFDSGTAFTRFAAPVYAAVRDEFRKRVGGGAAAVTSLGGFDTCYEGGVPVATITLMFRGMNLTLGQDNFLIKSTAGGLSCLAMASTPYDVNSALNVVANMQQQNHRVLYDIPNARLGVVREACT